MSSSNTTVLSAKIVTFSDTGAHSGNNSSPHSQPTAHSQHHTSARYRYTRKRLRNRLPPTQHREDDSDSESDYNREDFSPSLPNHHGSELLDGEGMSTSDGDLSTCSETWEEAWSAVNDHKVTEITINFFYRPRTLTLLLLVTILLVSVAFVRDEEANKAANVAAGIYALTFLFLSIGLLVFPNGPFTRPHPAFWRMVFGASVLYFLLFTFILFQRFSDVQNILMWIDPELNGSSTDSTKLYAVDCSFTWENLSSRLDVFIFAHFFGWIFKAVLVRHSGILWAISIMWECTELFFAHVLPNFAECWWDAIIFDVLICNGLGIYFGMLLCKWMEMKHFQWESIKHIKGARGKLKRAMLQFTPQAWSETRWMDPSSPYMRTVAIFILILLFQVGELNTFLLKHILYVPTSHYLVSLRLALMGLIAAPSLRQYFVYVTDRTCTRLGTQAWMCFAIMVAELLFSIKFGMRILPKPAVLYLVCWLVLIMLVSVCIVAILIRWTNRKAKILRTNANYINNAQSFHSGTSGPLSTTDYGTGDELPAEETAVLQRSSHHKRRRHHGRARRRAVYQENTTS